MPQPGSQFSRTLLEDEALIKQQTQHLTREGDPNRNNKPQFDRQYHTPYATGTDEIAPTKFYSSESMRKCPIVCIRYGEGYLQTPAFVEFMNHYHTTKSRHVASCLRKAPGIVEVEK